MAIVGDGTAYRQAIANRGRRMGICPVLQGSFDRSHSPDRLFALLFGGLICLANGLAGLAQIMTLAQLMRDVRQDFSCICPNVWLRLLDYPPHRESNAA